LTCPANGRSCGFPAEPEKGNQDRLLPVTPEFAEMLLAVHEAERAGRVFKLPFTRKDTVSKFVTNLGEAAGVKVNTDPRTAKVKFASAHDLRRSFGERWAVRVMPQVLMHLMRHESIETTMRYYVGRNAENTEDVLWNAYNSRPQSTACHLEEIPE
jgi:integrase